MASTRQQLLSGKTILITRPREQAEESVREVERNGGKAVVLPLIEISDPADWQPFDAAARDLAAFDGIVFTSTNAVQKFFRRLDEIGLDKSVLSQVRVYAVGDKSKHAVESHRVSVQLVPDKFTGEELARSIAAGGVSGKRFLLAKGNLSRGVIEEVLRSQGAEVTAVEVYVNSPASEERRRELLQRVSECDVLTFASPSAVYSAAAVVAHIHTLPKSRRPKIAVIGPTTQLAAQEVGFTVDIEPEHATMESLIEAIVHYFLESNHNPS